MKRGKKIYKVKFIDLEYTEPLAILNRSDAEELELKIGDKIYIASKRGMGVFTVTFSDKYAENGTILIPEKIGLKKGFEDGEDISISLLGKIDGLNYIIKKIGGGRLSEQEVNQIVDDIVNGRLDRTEIMGFILAQKYVGMDMDEIEALARAISRSGVTIEFDRPAYDKHSIGGVPGNKVSLLIVPIIASAGLLIPKTSSRAITSPAGTADTMEVLADVNLSVEEFIEVAKKTNGALIWGGALNLAPADDIIINVEKRLRLDPEPQMIASIMAKKMSVGIKTMVLDIPVGKEAKIDEINKAVDFARKVIEIGNRVGIRVQAGITYGGQPVGHNIGPALEAKEALEALINPAKAPASLIEKSCSLAGLLLEMSGKAPIGGGYNMAKEILYSGKAYEKMKEIIEAQGGNPNIKPDEINLGGYRYEVYAPVNGFVTNVSNDAINMIARAAGAPRDKGAGVILHVKRGRKVNMGDKILEIYAERSTKLQDAIRVLETHPPVIIEGMLLKTVPERIIYTFTSLNYSQGSRSE